MEQRGLGHAMHTHLVEFLRSFLRTPALEVLSSLLLLLWQQGICD